MMSSAQWTPGGGGWGSCSCGREGEAGRHVLGVKRGPFVTTGDGGRRPRGSTGFLYNFSVNSC